MAKTSYFVPAMKPEEIIGCMPLEAGNYPGLYSQKVERILSGISDETLRAKVKSTLGFFEDKNGCLAQSSPYRLVVLQSLLPDGKVLAARPRLEIARTNDSSFMSGFYVDFGLNLVGEQDYKVNPVQAKALADDLTDKGIGLTTPKLVSYSLLECRVDEKSPDGLVFRLSEKGQDLARSQVLNTLDFNWDYSPSNNGLFWAFLGRYGDWDAGDVLADSNDGGRVVVETTGEAGAEKFGGVIKIYTSEDLKIIRGVKEGRLPNIRLEEVLK